MNKLKTVLLMVLLVNVLQAQTKNIFLSREFWKTSPKIEIVEQKIKEGHNISELNQYGFDAVVYAILEKVPNTLIKYLLSKKGNSVNKLTHDKRTYVFWAAYANNVELMAYLIDRNARMDLKDAHHFSVLTFAAATGQTNKQIYDLCIKNGIDIKNDKDEHGANALLLIAPFLKDITLIEYFTSKGIDIHSTDDIGNGIFNYAAKNGNIEIMKRLIKLGVSYNTLNNEGGNAIIFASQGTRQHINSIETFKYLESLGINSNVTTTKGVTPLHALAYRSKDISTFNYFIDKGVDVNQATSDGNTPFLNAANNNTITIVSHLFKQVKNINFTNKDGKSALTNAVYKNSIDVVEFLLKQGADTSIKDKNGNNLTYYLFKSFDLKNIDTFNKKLALLIKHNLDLKETQGNGDTLFHLALETGNLDLLKRVNTMGININTKNNDGISPLQEAVMKAKDDTVLKYLLSVGADKTVKTDFDETIYDLAKENELLKTHNIDINFLK
ncbi:ankyrin repeat domain-containing protein [Flavivirga amylovorans]|uniref:Ankyrin repeat domain-containing protein n=1 Tax=Flavivirga amylovorans TaxID=870486 RepID=A0ABT8WZC4_9FLAO|nr:ankyrin repeat domain-containing protein [Flavivirga amylovorans]MDO5987034.1 ankyrin repeat domain-containing protein [Flavivirga amylovorans]